MSDRPYRYREDVVKDLRQEAAGLSDTDLTTKFEQQRLFMAIAQLSQRKNFPFIHLSGEWWLMIPAELYQVFKEEMEKRGLPIP